MNPETLPPLSAFDHSVDVQIRFNDIDILGHLNNTVYFSFYDTGKAYFYEHLMGGNMNWRKVESVIANIDCCYIHPIFFGEDISVFTRCMHVGDKSFRLQQVLVEKRTGQIKSACETVMVSFDPKSQTAVPLAKHWRDALEKEMKI